MRRATAGAIEFRILRPVELRINGKSVDLGPAKQRALLAVMLVSVGQPVTIDALVNRVWDNEPPDHVRNTIYTYISRLRGVFRGQMNNPLVRAGGGYVLDVAPETMDAHRFQLLAKRARQPKTSDQTRRDLLNEALNQWRGTPLSGVTGMWADGVRHGLEQQRINATTEWAALELRVGVPQIVIDRLHGLLADHPLAEALHGQLMRALYHAGRSAEAIEHYGLARDRIAAELGTQPGTALRHIYRKIAKAAMKPPAPDPRPGLASEPPWVGLRPRITRLIGRNESAQLAALLASKRLITVTGVGGCGKTALALNVAYGWVCQRRTAGFALALATVTSVEQAVHALAELLGVRDGGNHVDEAFAAVQRALAVGPRLLVFDNCEHLAGEIADLVSRMLVGCPELVVLATSRQPLDVPGETVLALQPLPVPRVDEPDIGTMMAVPSVQLFVERVREATPSITIAGTDLDHVAELCRKLDGLPLALELVAARARAFSLRDLVERVGRDLTLLFRTSSSGEPRHATLHATLNWSFQLLPTDQRRLFARMSGFAGGFTAADAEAVCGFTPLSTDTVAAQLAALLDRSLVQPYEVAGARRYRLLNVIRTFAQARLADLGERAATQRHHLDHWLTTVRDIDQLPRYQDRILRWQAMEPDAANLRQCLQFGLDAGHALDAAEIVARAFEFWSVNKGYLAEGRVWLQRMLLLPDLAHRPDVHALLRFHDALVVNIFGDPRHSLTLMLPVIGKLANHRPREHQEARACVLNSKMVALDPSVLDEVEPVVTAALASPEDDDACTVINAAGSTLNTWGRYQRTLDIGNAYDQRKVKPGRSSMAAKLTVTIEALLGLGDLARASILIDDLISLLSSIAHAAEHAAPRRVIASHYLASQQPDQAACFLDAALTTLTTASPPLTWRLVPLQILLAEAQRQCGDVTTALHTLRNSLTAVGNTTFKQAFPHRYAPP
jgi:predicted ATPase/DNA-binding SARP family transcriptional activator